MHQDKLKRSPVQMVAHVLALLVAYFIYWKIGGLIGLAVAAFLATFIELAFLIVLSPFSLIHRRMRVVGWAALIIAVPWLPFVFWKYREGPYVSFGTALFDSIPVSLLLAAFALLSTRRESKRGEQSPAPLRLPRSGRAAGDA